MAAGEVQCPRCLGVFPWAEYGWHDAQGSTYRKVAPTLLGRVRSRVVGDSRRDDRARAELLALGLKFSCPNGDEVPEDLNRQRTHVIALVGPSGSSKSHLLASMLHLLTSRDELAEFGQSVQFHSWCRAWFQNQYIAPLWNQHSRLPFNQSLEDVSGEAPTVALRLTDPWTRKVTNLIFVDSAGEDLMDATRMARHARYVSAADGIIFLVEPASLPGLVPLLPRNEATAPNSAAEVVAQTARTMRFIRGVAENHVFDNVPVAVAIGKSDLLAQSRRLPPFWLYEPSDRSYGHRLESVSVISDQVGGLIERSHGRGLLLELHGAFSKHSFHLVSATGCSIGSDGLFPRVAPMRCIDPLLFLLGALGVVSDKRG